MKLCIIDDDELIHSLYKLFFNELMNNFETESCHNGLEAIRIFENPSEGEKGIPDIVLLDINMPIMNGIQFLDHFERIAPSLRKVPSIFILSSCFLESDLLRSRRYVTEVFNKPMTKEIVKKMIFNHTEYE